MYQTKIYENQQDKIKRNIAHITRPEIKVDKSLTKELTSYSTINNNIFIGFAVFAITVFCVAIFSLML